jgi:hypothetical protein
MQNECEACAGEWGRSALAFFAPKDLASRAKWGRAWAVFSYVAVLGLLGGLVLVAFVRPTERHAGINGNYRSLFMDMVNGTAHRPFVYRALLPAAIRAASAAVPEGVRQACAEAAAGNRYVRLAFAVFEWETEAAFEFGLAALAMYLCLVGFGHVFVRLANRTCNLSGTGLGNLGLACAALLLLPPFFRYTSFPYDPPQLFLFTLALLLLAQGRRGVAFFGVFALCCINKETAVLLIPLYALAHVRREPQAWRRGWMEVAGLGAIYLAVKLGLTWAFRENPGEVVEFQLAHNLRLFVNGWTFGNVGVFLGLAALTGYRWEEKPLFLKNAFWVVAPPLVALALFLGFIDEWRGYYEAYPIVFCLGLDSVLRIRRALGRDAGDLKLDA